MQSETRAISKQRSVILPKAGGTRAIFVRMQCNIAPLHAHENVSVPPWVICTLILLLSIHFHSSRWASPSDFPCNRFFHSLIFHECKKNMLFSHRCVYVPQVSVLEYFYVWRHKKKVLEQVLQKVGDDGT